MGVFQQPARTMEETTGGLMGRKVLVIDDEEGIRNFVKAILRKKNYVVEEAIDGEQAIGKIMKEDYDFFICDIRMPKKNGWEVLKVIRSNPTTREAPVIVLTGLIDNQDMKKAYDLGANYYITKPFTPAQLNYGTMLMFGEVENFWKA